MLANTTLQGPRLQPISLSGARFSFSALSRLFSEETFSSKFSLEPNFYFLQCLSHRYFIQLAFNNIRIFFMANTTHLAFCQKFRIALFSSFRTLCEFTLSRKWSPNRRKREKKGNFWPLNKVSLGNTLASFHWQWSLAPKLKYAGWSELVKR